MLTILLKRKTGHENRRWVAEAMALQSAASRRLACYRKTRWLRGQQVMEYAVFISVLSAAFLTMYLYSQRGLQSVIKVSVDQIGSQVDGEQFIGSDNTQTTSTTLVEAYDNTLLNNTGGQSIVETNSFSKATGLSTTTSESY